MNYAELSNTDLHEAYEKVCGEAAAAYAIGQSSYIIDALDRECDKVESVLRERGLI